MTAPQIKQFKLSNDDEIICEVLEWDSDENAAILIRAALRIIQGIDPDTKMRFFAFRPWMGFQDNPELMQTINAGHVIGEATPSEDLLRHYATTITEQIEASKNKKPDLPLDDVYGMDDEELADYLADKYATVDEELEMETNGNVITFPKLLH
jgi:hypothetical protein